jgi:hypothetical protein
MYGYDPGTEYDVTIEAQAYRRICPSRVVNDKGESIGGLDVLRKNHVRGLRWEAVAKTDENGMYEVSDLISGMTYSFCALSDEYGTAVSNVLWSQGTSSLKPIVVVPRDKVLEGVAVDEQGRAVAGAKISVEPSLGVLSKVSSDEDGRFRFTGLVEGEVWLQAYKRGRHVHGGMLIGSQKCSAGDKEVKLVLGPLPDAW